MSVSPEEIKKIWYNKASVLGYSAAATLMSSLYPVDFESYMIAFELCDSDGKTIDYFTFPIMPTELTIEEETPVKVENTFGGVNTISSNVYVPKNIHLSGNFGRQFRLLSRNKFVLPIYQFKNQVTQERDYGVGGNARKFSEISHELKTGFGCFKILQSIVNRAVEIDKHGECNKLYMYNMAYGENYVVKPINFRGSQSISNNGIWNYDLSLKAVCPLHLDSHKRAKTLKAAVSVTLQAALNNTLSGVRQQFNLLN